MVLPTPFSTSSPANVSVGLTDFLTNTGYLSFFGGKTADNYLMSTIAFYSNGDELITNPGANTANDIDFDAVSQAVLTLEGKAIVTVPLLLLNNAGGGAMGTTMTVTLRHWDGTTETDIVSENVVVSQTVGSGSNIGFVFTVDMTVPTTFFAVGDTIRVNVVTTAPGTNLTISVVHSPKDRDITVPTITTQPDTHILQALIPVKLDD